ncbi:MAG TPA: formate dehydrogenase subunit gamma [Alphaproteobacteria bacterium]|nr:formate dehydrogenase subunit gamma [Alphaproteobacteria bacterium]
MTMSNDVRRRRYLVSAFAGTLAAVALLGSAEPTLGQAPPAEVKSTSVPAISKPSGPTNLTPTIPTAPAIIETNATARPLAGHTVAQSQEAALLAALKGSVTGYVSLPDQKSATLVQDGRSWRGTVGGPLRVWGMWLVVGMIAVLLAFYLLRGRIRIDSGFSGRTVRRFSGLERFVHWLTASSFVVLAISGLNITYGRYVLLPILGPDAFTAISIALKYAHNFIAFPFMAGVLLMLVLWLHHNIPNRYDVQWLAVAGGLFRKGVHPPAGKFNAGQKLIFWSVILGGVALTVTGIYLLFPFQFGDVQDQQTMQIIHAIVALVLTAIILAHIYIGSLGMEGAWDAMGSGDVDENWAREHHSQWVAQMRGEPEPRGGHD